MANPTCTSSSLNTACFAGNVLSQRQRKALLVWFKASELKLIGGTDYTAVLTSPASTGLLGATQAFCDSDTSMDYIGERYIGLFELSVALNTATAAGLAAATINALMASTKCLLNINDQVLDTMVIFLDCQLGVHKTYPQ